MLVQPTTTYKETALACNLPRKAAERCRVLVKGQFSSHSPLTNSLRPFLKSSAIRHDAYRHLGAVSAGCP